jgi:hypothetical protein
MILAQFHSGTSALCAYYYARHEHLLLFNILKRMQGYLHRFLHIAIKYIARLFFMTHLCFNLVPKY